MKLNSNFFFAVVMTALLTTVLAVSGNGLGVGGVALLFLACYPWTINGNVYSLFGGYSEKSIYSLIGVVQQAKVDAVCFFAFTVMQHAGYEAIQIFGVSFIQLSDEGDVTQWFGISIMQGGIKCHQWLGLILFQYSLAESVQWAGAAAVQVSKGVAVQVAGISLFQSGGREAGQAVGLALYQKAELITHYGGLAFYQRAKEFDTKFTSINVLQGAW